jgi:hypothetical protein
MVKCGVLFEVRTELSNRQASASKSSGCSKGREVFPTPSSNSRSSTVCNEETCKSRSLVVKGKGRRRPPDGAPPPVAARRTWHWSTRERQQAFRARAVGPALSVRHAYLGSPSLTTLTTDDVSVLTPCRLVGKIPVFRINVLSPSSGLKCSSGL